MSKLAARGALGPNQCSRRHDGVYAPAVRVHVISDLEGVSGVVKGGQTAGGEPMFEEARRLYTEEINAAVRGAKAAGATEIVVMDCHGAGKEWSFNSLVPDLLEPDCEFVVQEDWTEYTGFLEEGCDAALLIGMHAMAGAGRRRDEPHRVRPRLLQPALQRDARRRDGDPRRPLRHLGLPGAARHRRRRRLRRGASPARRRADDRRGQDGPGSDVVAPDPARAGTTTDRGRCEAALSDLSAVAPWSPGSPCEITVEFKHTLAADKLRFRPGVERVDDRTISVTAATWWEAWKAFYF